MPSAKQIDFGFRVARMSRRLRQAVDAELRLIGLTEATWRPLIYVRRLGDGVRQKELATAMSIEGPSLVRLLDSLERRGFIERREDETDRRARGIYLTRAGRDLAVRAARSATTCRRACWPACRPADLEICERVLETLERELEERLAKRAADDRRSKNDETEEAMNPDRRERAEPLASRNARRQLAAQRASRCGEEVLHGVGRRPRQRAGQPVGRAHRGHSTRSACRASSPTRTACSGA